MNDFWKQLQTLFSGNNINPGNQNNVSSFNLSNNDTSSFMDFGNLSGQGFNPSNSIDVLGTANLSNQLTQAAQEPGLLSMDSMFGGGDGPGWLNGGVSVLNGLGNTWLGMQQYGLAKDSFNFNKGLATQNYENQSKLTNRSLEASLRRNAVAQGNDPEQAVSQGMDKWGLDKEVGG